MYLGIKAAIGIAFQNSYGTAPSVQSYMWLPIITESLDPDLPPMYPNDNTGVLEEAHEVEQGASRIGGDITLNAGPITLGALLKAVIGDPTTAIAGSSYQHTFVPRSGDFDIYTAQRPCALFKGWAGVNTAEIYSDMALNTLELSCAAGEFLKIKAGFVGGTPSDAAPQTPSFPAGRRLPWDVASIQVGSSTGMSGRVDFKQLNVTFDNALEAQHAMAGSLYPSRLVRTGFRKMKISGTMFFDNRLDYDAFKAQTERRFLATFVSKDTIMTNTRNILELSAPSMRFSELKKPTPGPGRVEVQFTADAVYNAGSGHAFRATLSNTQAAY